MKLTKRIGLSAVAAVAAMAFVGAPSATANSTSFVLCENAELVCEKPFPNPTTVVAHAFDSLFLTSLGTILCEDSLVEIALLNELSTLGVGHLLALSFENCTLGKTSCKVTASTLGLLSFTKIGALEASARSTGGTEIMLVCGIISCLLKGEPLLQFHSTGVGTTSLLAVKKSLQPEGKTCPNTVLWDATYIALGAMYVES